MTFEFFSICRAREIPVSGPLLQEKAQKFATRMELDFKGSVSWLEKFKKRYGIASLILFGGVANISYHIVNEWKSKISSVTRDVK